VGDIFQSREENKKRTHCDWKTTGEQDTCEIYRCRNHDHITFVFLFKSGSGLDLKWLRTEMNDRICYHDDEPSGRIKAGNLLNRQIYKVSVNVAMART